MIVEQFGDGGMAKQDEAERSVVVVLIAAISLVIYFALLAYVLTLIAAALPHIGSSYLFFLALYVYPFLGVAYCVVGIIGTVRLLRDWRSHRVAAIIEYAFECVILSIILIFRVSPYDGYIIIYHYQFIFVVEALIFFKIVSIVYLARKKA
jgi:hypothetical protein